MKDLTSGFRLYWLGLCYLFVIDVVVGTSVNVGQSTESMEGSTVVLRCTFSKKIASVNAEPIVHWSLLDKYDNPQPILTRTEGTTHREDGYPRHSVSGEADLQIQNVQKEDNGKYRCRVQIIGDTPNEDFGDISLKVYWLSEAVSNVPSHGIVVGGNATMTCRATGDNMPSVYWKKDNIELPLTSRSHMIRSDHTLIIYSVSRADDGMYVCGARNNVREETSPPKRLEVYFSPVINDISVTKTVINQNVTVTFEVESNPPASLMWTKDGHVVEGMTTSSFTFYVPEEEVGKSYELTLTATNPVGHMQKMTSVIIGDSCGYATVSDMKTGRTIEGESVSLKEGKSMTLVCSVNECESADTYSYEWYKNGVKLSSSANIEIIDASLMDDNMKYTCRVRGGIPFPSSASFRIHIKVPLLEPMTIIIISACTTGFIFLIVLIIFCLLFCKRRSRMPKGYKYDDSTMKSGFSYNEIEFVGLKEKDDSSDTTSGIGPDILEQSRLSNKKAYKSKAVHL
ncbi:cell adhesion molecule CEACAM2-like [Antedon mediterranea]|uniref:cell adhesion molecule CEACAM2-like n=1 Tax=Antedon mediterranea TaxID=105859 RepID=UPI003AF99955